MKIHPLFKWFGSKWQSGKHYPSPMHDIVVEPFAGGAGYSLNYPEKKVFLWDDDPNLIQLWPYLIDRATETEIRDIPVGLSVGTDIRSVGLNRGQELLLKHWQRTNNVGDCWKISPWGHLPGQWTENTRARVAEEIRAIKHWEFRRNFPNYSSCPATWFIDPPYQYNYRYRVGMPDYDHRIIKRFVEELSMESLVIVCEATRKEDGAIPDYLPFQPSHRSVTSRRKASQSHHSNELSWVRLPLSSAEPLPLSLPSLPAGEAPPA